MAKFLLKGPYFPDHSLNRMRSEGDVASARKGFIARPFRNLDYLLRLRYGWMNRFIEPGWQVVEVGAGAGFSEFYLSEKPLLRLMRHEGWSYGVDVFDEEAVANDPSDIWSANCAVAELLFEEVPRFEERFGTLKVELNRKSEFLIFPLSGGVIAKTGVPELPGWLLKLVHLVDDGLTTLFPDIFAMSRSVAIRKKG